MGFLSSFETVTPPEVAHPALVRADEVQARGITGASVTVAVLDSGFEGVDGLMLKDNGMPRLLGGYDAINDTTWTAGGDPNGHGTHVASIAINSDRSPSGAPTGIAPGADLVFVKAFDENGAGRYIDVIAGLDWILDNHERLGIRVLNLSFSAPARSHYWDDPINQAVMKLWRAGVVVVASAGNQGPAAQTIGVPGNVPYIITVGAMSDNYTAAADDDVLASFSSTGPTYEGFVKPEVVAPGAPPRQRQWSQVWRPCCSRASPGCRPMTSSAS